jgi:hypothetical protein
MQFDEIFDETPNISSKVATSCTCTRASVTSCNSKIKTALSSYSTTNRLTADGRRVEQSCKSSASVNSKLTKEYEIFLSKYTRLLRSSPSKLSSSSLSLKKHQKCGCSSSITASSTSLLSSSKNYERLDDFDSSSSLLHIQVKPCDLLNTLSQMVSCIGCRASVERFYKQIAQKQHDQSSGSSNCSISNNKYSFKYMLDPFVLGAHGCLTLRPSFINPFAIYSLFYANG